MPERIGRALRAQAGVWTGTVLGGHSRARAGREGDGRSVPDARCRAGAGTSVLSRRRLAVGAGLALGLVAALGATRFLSSLSHGVGQYDLVTFVAVPIVVAVVGLLACGLPALRASRVDPIVALRYE